MRIYNKRGNTNYKEKRLIEEIKSAIERKKKQDPNFTFEPANDAEELKALHDKLCTEDAEYTEVSSEASEDVSSQSNNMGTEAIDEVQEESATFVDPFNAEEPTVRDYVKEKGSTRTLFDEPKDFNSTFEMPSPEDEQSSSSSEQPSQKQQKPKKETAEPVNPYNEDMDNSAKNQSTKQLAKYIVEVTCKLLETGYVWYGTKDITDTKLLEYETSGEMDLSLLVTLTENQQVTCKQFFQSQVYLIKEQAAFTDDEKKDLTKALSAVLMEKGITATPMQQLAIVGLGIIGTKAIGLFQIKSQISSVLASLREIGVTSGAPKYQTPQTEERPYREPEHVTNPSPTIFESEQDKAPEEAAPEVQELTPVPVLESPIQTTE